MRFFLFISILIYSSTHPTFNFDVLGVVIKIFFVLVVTKKMIVDFMKFPDAVDLLSFCRFRSIFQKRCSTIYLNKSYSPVESASFSTGTMRFERTVERKFVSIIASGCFSRKVIRSLARKLYYVYRSAQNKYHLTVILDYFKMKTMV